MSTLEDHMSDTLKNLGGAFEEIHRHLDQWQSVYGAKHRFMLHHKEGVEEVRKKFGDKAAEAAQSHIRLDCGNRIPRKEDYKTKKVDWLGFGEGDFRIIDKR